MKRILLALFLVATMLTSMLSASSVSAATEYSWDIVNLTFDDASDAEKLTMFGGTTNPAVVADGMLKETVKNTRLVAGFENAVTSGKVIMEFKFRTPNTNTFFHVHDATTGQVQLGINGSGSLYMKGSWVDVDGDATTGNGGKETSGVFFEGANDGEWHVVTIEIDLDAKTIFASADGGEKLGGPIKVWSINGVDTIAVGGLDFFLHSAAGNITGGATGTYLDVDYFRASTGATVTAPEGGDAGEEPDNGDESENNGDTSDMTVSLVVSAVALLGTAVVISKKRSK